MHDREARLNGWRDRLRTQESFTEQHIAELEAHLRDQLSDLEEKGLSPEESWLVGERRLGTAEALAVEYRRNDPCCVARSRFAWGIIGILLFSLFSSLLSIVHTAVGGVYLSVVQHAMATGYRFGGLVVPVHGLLVACVIFVILYAVYRACFAGRGEAWGNRLSTLADSPGWFLSMVIGAMALDFLIRTGSNVLTVRMVPAEAAGVLALTNSYAIAMWSLALPIALVVSLQRLRGQPS